LIISLGIVTEPFCLLIIKIASRCRRGGDRHQPIGRPRRSILAETYRLFEGVASTRG
jgi:hypothetical protein